MANEPYIIGASYAVPNLEFVFRAQDSSEYPCSIPADIDVELLAALGEVEQAIESRGKAGALGFVDALKDGKRMILTLLRQSNADIPEDAPMGIADVYGVITFILNGKTAAETIRDGLLEAMWGEDGTPLPGTAEDVDKLPGEADGVTEGASEGPLSEPSKKRSAPSARRTSGRRTTGKTSRGESSASSSAKRAAA